MNLIHLMSDKDRARFFSKVINKSPEACHEWVGGRCGEYGQFHYKGRGVYAHRVAYMLANNTELPSQRTNKDNVCVLHSCDNTLCCNPSHLTIGSHLDNTRDKHEKNRSNIIGESHYGAKVTEKDVLDIRRILREKIERHAQGLGTRRFANLMKAVMEHYGLSHAAVNDIIFNRSWKHI